jgi:hypothetical protein
MSLATASIARADIKASPRHRRQERLPHLAARRRSGACALVADIGRELDAIYLKMDVQLTRMAELQLELDELRAKIRRL